MVTAARPLVPAAFLDRDGVIVRSEVIDGKAYAPRRLEDLRLLPGAAESVRRLKSYGFLVVVVTNQPDVGNGFVERSLVEAMHEKLHAKLLIDHIEVCYHAQSAGCTCRKPKPGMLHTAAQKLSIDLAASFMVGDRVSDLEAGSTAGCRTVFIDRGYRETGPVHAWATARSLPGAVRRIEESLTAAG